MSGKSTIEWTVNPDGTAGATWNPLVAEDRIDSQLRDVAAKNRWACIKKSPGCDNCYASTLNVRYGGTPFAERGAKEPNAKVVLNLATRGDSSITAPDRWTRPRTIFVGSMTDWAGEWVEPIHQDMMLDVAWRNPRHTFQFLTKRPDRSLAALDRWLKRNGLDMAPPHMWFGTTIEMGSLAWRADHLGRHRAHVRFVSAEPLIGHLDLANALQAGFVNWVIVGGESGAGARPMHPAWARLLIAQARDNGVPVFLKQWGNWSPEPYRGARRISFDIRGRQLDPNDPGDRYPTTMTTMYRYASKHDAGRTIDGRTWDQIPARPWMRQAAACDGSPVIHDRSAMCRNGQHWACRGRSGRAGRAACGCRCHTARTTT